MGEGRSVGAVGSGSEGEVVVHLLPAEKSDGCQPARLHPGPGSIRRRPGESVAEPSPGEEAGEAGPVQERRLVIVEAGLEQVHFPGCRRRLVALELLQNQGQAHLAVQPAGGGEVLPAEEEAHELGGGDRRDPAAEPAQGQAVDAGQESPLAPLGLPGAGPKTSSEGMAFRLQCVESRRCSGFRYPEASAEFTAGQGAGGVEPAADQFGQGLLVIQVPVALPDRFVRIARACRLEMRFRISQPDQPRPLGRRKVAGRPVRSGGFRRRRQSNPAHPVLPQELLQQV